MQLGSTTPVLKLLVQQSNCFVVVDRGKAMGGMMNERALQASGELRKGSRFGKGQMVAARLLAEPFHHIQQPECRWCGSHGRRDVRDRWSTDCQWSLG